MPKRVYLQPKDLARKSRHHTAYAGIGEVSDAGHGKQLVHLEFDDGVATNVDETKYRVFKDLGIAGERRPATHPEDTEGGGGDARRE